MEKTVQPSSSNSAGIGRKITLAERIALQTTQQQLNMLKQQVAQGEAQLMALLKDMGLDPAKTWNMSPDGMLTEVEAPPVPSLGGNSHGA